MNDDERAWRMGWAFAYSAGYLYGDDGELQDNRLPMIDWMRDSAQEIARKIHERGMRMAAIEFNQPQYREPTLEDAWQLKSIQAFSALEMQYALKQLGFVRKVQP